MGAMLLLWMKDNRLPHAPERSEERTTDNRNGSPFRWRWSILFISIFLSLADYVYFYSLSMDGALISVVSMVRRSSVLVSFMLGALLFHEKNLRSKAIDLALVLLSMFLLWLGQ